MKSDDSLERRLRALRRAVASPDLRARVLALASAVERPRVTITERIWASRPLRLAWAASMAILILLDPLAARGAPAGDAARETRDASRAALRKLAREAGLPGDRLRSLVHRREIQLDINGARRDEFEDLGGELEM